MLDMHEYTCIYLNKQSSEYARMTYRELIHIQNTVKHLRWSFLQKQYYLSAAKQPEVSQGRVGFVDLAHFDKYFIQNTRRKGPQENNLEVFFLNTLKPTFWMENVTQICKYTNIQKNYNK